MIKYIFNRLLQGLIVVILVSSLVFLMMRFLPGDPLLLFEPEDQMATLSPEARLELERQYGLDKSIFMQYIDWVRDILHGDLGKSLLYQEDVTQLILECLPVTFHLGIISFIISSAFGIFFGTICGLRRGKWIDTFFTILANLGITVPSFLIGVLLIYMFTLKLGWLPSFGYTSPFENFGLNFKQIIMPVLCLSVFSIASLTRQCRSSILEIVQQDYVRTAWAKGLKERLIISRHIIKNALIPVITVVGLHIRVIFGGSVIIETVFNIPGMGRLLTEAIFSHDYQVVQTGVILIAVIIILANMLVDISYGWLNPKIRFT